MKSLQRVLVRLLRVHDTRTAASATSGPAIVGERVRVRLRRDEKVFDILRSVTFIATFASRAKSIARVHDAHESFMFLPDCTPAFRGIFSSENSINLP